MKIIKKGNPKSFNTVCPYCDSVLEFTKSDINLKIDGFIGVLIPYIVCLNCESSLVIPDDELEYLGLIGR